MYTIEDVGRRAKVKDQRKMKVQENDQQRKKRTHYIFAQVGANVNRNLAYKCMNENVLRLSVNLKDGNEISQLFVGFVTF